MQNHETYMRHAIDAARRNPACPFGAALIDGRSGEVVATGYNRAHSNPTWHGEIDAINQFVAADRGDEWSQLRLYTTAEPCCMCQGAILWAGIPSVYFGTSIERLRQMGWRQIQIPASEVARRSEFARCELVGGLLVNECDYLFAAAAHLSEPIPGRGR